jgi:hypothetical protein
MHYFQIGVRQVILSRTGHFEGFNKTKVNARAAERVLKLGFHLQVEIFNPLDTLQRAGGMEASVCFGPE